MYAEQTKTSFSTYVFLGLSMVAVVEFFRAVYFAPISSVFASVSQILTTAVQ